MKVEVIGLIMTILPLLVNLLDQGVSGGIGTCIQGCAVGQMGVCHPGHMGDGVLAIATRCQGLCASTDQINTWAR